MTLDEAVDLAMDYRNRRAYDGGGDVGADFDKVDYHGEVRDVISAEVDRLAMLATWEAKFARSILEPLSDELYTPQLGNAAIA